MGLQILLQPLGRDRDSPPNKIKDDVFLTVPDLDDALQTGSVDRLDAGQEMQMDHGNGRAEAYRRARVDGGELDG